MVFICYGLLRALQTESGGSTTDLSLAGDTPPPEAESLNWQQRLASITRYHDETEIVDFLADTARPALDAVAAQMRENGLTPELTQDPGHLDITVPRSEEHTSELQ